MSTRNLPVIESQFSELKAANRLLNIAEYEEGKKVLQSYPRVIFVELTQNCNLYCPMCRVKSHFNPKKNMLWKIFQSVADELFPYAELVDLRGFGESTILKHFPKFVDYASQFGCQLKLFTNLAIKRDVVWQQLASQGATLAVSFDGATKSTFEKIRTGANFDVVQWNLAHLAEWYEQYGFDVGNYVYFSTTVQRDNLHELVEILKLMSEYKINLIKLFPISCSEYDPLGLEQCKSRLQDILFLATEFARTRNISLELGESLHPELTYQDKLIDRCIHPWTYCTIDYQGKIGFCDNLISMPSNIVGNLKDQPFHQIWNGVSYQNLREQHVVSRPIVARFDACNHCYKNRYNEIEHLSVPSHSMKIVSSDLGDIVPS
ncbi:MAG: hypothetical protein GY861_11160 [bacterium]|nr:hypothetical protein [bacterium]